MAYRQLTHSLMAMNTQSNACSELDSKEKAGLKKRGWCGYRILITYITWVLLFDMKCDECVALHRVATGRTSIIGVMVLRLCPCACVPVSSISGGNGGLGGDGNILMIPLNFKVKEVSSILLLLFCTLSYLPLYLCTPWGRTLYWK